VQVTLDPSTASPQLLVSPDGSSVKWGGDDVPQVPPLEGITQASVLGLETISSGRCCWQLEVIPEGSWAVGVAKVKKKEKVGSSPLDLWAMGCWEGQVWALSSMGH
ncbi:TRIM7 ligase, partial [Galbula dea]|nr:TRIM7 ligase [Galbula dea]